MLILKALKKYFLRQERKKKKSWGMTWKFEYLKNKGSAFFIFHFWHTPFQFTAHAFGHRFNCLLYPRIMTYHSSDLVNLNSVQPLNQWWANPLMAICVFPMHPKEFCNTLILLHRITCTPSPLVILSGS